MAVIVERREVMGAVPVDQQEQLAKLGLQMFCRSHGRRNRATGMFEIKVPLEERAVFERFIDRIINP